MKINKVIIENFRSYKDSTEVLFNDLTVIIGKNDVGKSTILEALDIFFENRKMDTDDINIEAIENKENPKISVIFSDLPDFINIDAGAKTSLKDEYLLNSEMLFEIKKEYSNIAKPRTFIICNHPSNEIANSLHSLKLAGLQKIIKEQKISGNFKENVKNEMRKAIWESFGNGLLFNTTEIEISQEGVKDLWDKIYSELPLFALFSSDRKNDEKDKEIQDPLKWAAEQALKKYNKILNRIKDRVETEVTAMANLTIEKLKEMNPDVANDLKSEFPAELKWADLFKPSITSDGIPMNKRGSGVRRLLLINFFRAEAEKKKKEKNSPNIIYAIEEPETSQHPDWQKKLIEALNELASNGIAQVIVTTHSPGLASIVNINDIRFLYKQRGKNIIEAGNDNNLETIAKTLGILPTLEKHLDKVKVFLCLEGPTDIEFFQNISHLFNIDLKNDNRIVCISLGGGTVGHWVTNNYLKKLNKKEVHIYDKDEDQKYKEFVDQINLRGNDHYATLTIKREIENYYDESIIIPSFENHDGFCINFVVDDTSDIPKHIAELRHQIRNPNKKWEEQSGRYRDKCENFVKSYLCRETSKLLTIDLLKKRNAFNEVNNWFEEIKKRI